MYARLLPIFGLIVFGVISRLLPHPPNFTPINAIALFSVLYLDSKWLSLATLFATMLLSDLILGFHGTMPYVYLSFGLVIFAGHSLVKNGPILRIPAAGFASALLFFLVTNFGAWTTDHFYPKTAEGLGLCYLAAIPFFVNQIAGDLLYASLLYFYMGMIKGLVLTPVTENEYTN